MILLCQRLISVNKIRLKKKKKNSCFFSFFFGITKAADYAIFLYFYLVFNTRIVPPLVRICTKYNAY